MKRKADKADMPFWDHLEALRLTIFKALGLVVVLAVVLFVSMPTIIDRVVLAPCHPDFVTYRWFASLARAAADLGLPASLPDEVEVSLINIRLASQFMLHMSLSFWLAVVLGFPGLIALLWQFVEPALLPAERRGARTAFLLGAGMFYLGVATGYMLVFPLTLRFLAAYSLSPEIVNQLSLDSYIDNFLTLCLAMGLLFELPLVTWLLGRAGVLTRGFFARFRRHAVVALLVLAAIITPTGDPFTMLTVFIPIYLLWELSALLVPPTPTTATLKTEN